MRGTFRSISRQALVCVTVFLPVDGPTEVIAEHPSELGNGLRDDVVADVLVLPDPFEELITAQHLSRAAGERHEDLHRLRLDVDDLSLPLEDETRWPDGPAVELEIGVQRAPPR